MEENISSPIKQVYLVLNIAVLHQTAPGTHLVEAMPGDRFIHLNSYDQKNLDKKIYGYLKHSKEFGHLTNDNLIPYVPFGPEASNQITLMNKQVEYLTLDDLRYGIYMLCENLKESKLEEYYKLLTSVVDLVKNYSTFIKSALPLDQVKEKSEVFVNELNSLRKFMNKDIVLCSIGEDFKPNYSHTLDLFDRYRKAQGKYHFTPYIEMTKDIGGDEKNKHLDSELTNLYVKIVMTADQTINWINYELRFCLYDPTTKEFPYITDVWCVIPEVIESIAPASKDTKHRVEPAVIKFKNVKMSDFYKNLILVGKVYYNSTEVSKKQKHMPIGSYRMYEGGFIINSQHLPLDKVESSGMDFYLCSDKGYADLHAELKKNVGKGSVFKIELYLLVSKETPKEIEKIHPAFDIHPIFDIQPSYISNYELLESKIERCDIFINMHELLLDRKLKPSKYIIKIVADIVRQDGSRLNSLSLYFGDNQPPCDIITSFIVRNTNNPFFNQQFRISLSPLDYNNLYLRFLIYSYDKSENEKYQWRVDCFTVLPISNTDGCITGDGIYKLHLIDKKFFDSFDANSYLKWDYMFKSGAQTYDPLPIENSYFSITFQLVSTTMTSDENIIYIRNYEKKPDLNYNSIITSLLKLPNHEKIKHMNELSFQIIEISEKYPIHYDIILNMILEILTFISSASYINFANTFKSKCNNVVAPNYPGRIFDTLYDILGGNEVTESHLEIIKLLFKSMNLFIYLMSKVVQNNSETNDNISARHMIIKLFHSIKECSFINQKVLLASTTTFLKRFTHIFYQNPDLFSLEDIYDITNCVFGMILKNRTTTIVDNEESTNDQTISPMSPFIRPFYIDFVSFCCSHFRDSVENIILFTLKSLFEYFPYRQFKEIHIILVCTYIKYYEIGYIHMLNNETNVNIRHLVVGTFLKHNKIYTDNIKWNSYEFTEYFLDCFISILRYISVDELEQLFRNTFQDQIYNIVMTFVDLCNEILMSSFFKENNFKVYALTIVTLFKYLPFLSNFENLSQDNLIKISISVDDLIMNCLCSDSLRFELLSPSDRITFLQQIDDIRVELLSCIVSHWKLHVTAKDRYIIVLFGYAITETLKQQAVENSQIGKMLFILILDIYEYCWEYEILSNSYIKDFIIDTLTSERGVSIPVVEQYLDNFQQMIKNRLTSNSQQGMSPTMFLGLENFLIQLKKIILICDVDKDVSLIGRDILLYALKKTPEIINEPTLYGHLMAKMAAYQIQKNNMIEAAHCYLELADTMEWSDVFLCANQKFHVGKKEKNRKFDLYIKALEIIYAENCEVEAMEIYTNLHPIIENILFDFNLASNYYRKHADCTLQAIENIRPYPNYFMINFNGKIFGEGFDGKSFIYCRKNYAKLGEVIKIIQAMFPNAVITSTANSGENKEPISQNRILITGVNPIASSNLAQNIEVCESIRTYYQHNKVNQFIHIRPISNAADPSNTWTEKIVYTTEFNFPAMLCISPIVEVSVTKMSPIENAIDDISSKNRNLMDIITQVKMKNPSFNEKLTSTLNGVIDSAVNGGVAKYCKEFLSCDIEEINQSYRSQLKDVLAEHVKMAMFGLHEHKIVVSQDLSELHDKLVLMSIQMKSLIESYVGIDLPWGPINLDEAETTATTTTTTEKVEEPKSYDTLGKAKYRTNPTPTKLKSLTSKSRTHPKRKK